MTRHKIDWLGQCGLERIIFETQRPPYGMKYLASARWHAEQEGFTAQQIDAAEAAMLAAAERGSK